MTGGNAVIMSLLPRLTALALASLAGCSTARDVTVQPPPVTAPAPVALQRPANIRPDLAAKWFDASGNLLWPPNDGFAAPPAEATLPPGTLIDRYGSEGGRFFSPAHASYAGRALPYAQDKMPYTVYRVEAPLRVQAGTAAPWFDAPGGAVQYKTEEPAYRLRAQGTLVAVPQ